MLLKNILKDIEDVSMKFCHLSDNDQLTDISIENMTFNGAIKDIKTVRAEYVNRKIKIKTFGIRQIAQNFVQIIRVSLGDFVSDFTQHYFFSSYESN